MTRLITAFGAALMLALSGWLPNAALAQDKKMEKEAKKVAIKVITENDKVRVTEVTFAPGAQNTTIATSSMRVVRALKGGTIERTYADGKKEIVTYKDGETRINMPGPQFNGVNVGKSTIQLYVVQLK